MASPTTPAPAISGPMFTPIEESTIRATSTNNTVRMNLRSSSKSVPVRVPPGPPPSPSVSAAGISCRSRLSMRALANSHTMNPSSRVTTMLSTCEVKIRPNSRSTPHSPSTMKNMNATSTSRSSRRISGT